MRSENLYKAGALAVLAVFLAALLATAAHTATIMASGIGMSGSLQDLSPVTLPQGATLRSDSYFIVVFNFMDKPVEVRLGYEAPKGITVSFEPNETEFKLPPHGHKRFLVIVHVSNTTVPGNYTVYVKAYVVRHPEPGKVAVLEGAAQRLIIHVVGSYAYIHVRVVDPAGHIARNALVRLYRRLHGHEISIADRWGGVLDAKVVPGNYTVKAFLAGELAASRRVTLHNHDNKTIILHATILYIERFTVEPLISGGKLIALRLHIVLKNIYHTLRGVNVYLVVKRNGKLYDRRILVASSTLPLGRSEYFFDYTRAKGFEPGNYTLEVVVKGFGGKTLAVSQPRWVYVKGSPPWLLAVLAIAAIIAAAALAKRRIKNQRGD